MVIRFDLILMIKIPVVGVVGTDGRVGIFVGTSRESKSSAMALTREELIHMTGWLVNYINETSMSKPK